MIIITGATGNVGRPLIASLVSAGHVVTAVARGTSADLPGGTGIIPVAADLTDPGAARSLADSMAGAEALFLLVPGSGAGVDAAALLETARTASVQRVVLLSSQAVGSRPGAAAYAPLAAIEAAVTRSGLGWTILRAGGLAANAFAWAPAVRAKQTVFAPYGDVEQMLQFMPAPVADATLAILGHPTPGEAQGSPGVEKVLGRPGHSFADWAHRNAAAFR